METPPYGTVTEFLDRFHGVVGPVFQVADQWSHLVQVVEDVATTGHTRQRLLLPGTQSLGKIGDDGLRPETALKQFQQPHAPGVAISMPFKTKKVAIGGTSVDADQHGVAG